jgi:hypothetical protein
VELFEVAMIIRPNYKKINLLGNKQMRVVLIYDTIRLLILVRRDQVDYVFKNEKEDI